MERMAAPGFAASAPDRSPLADRLRERIRTHGPISLADFMEAALYDPEEGFYERSAVGQNGDFVTSPHVSGAFGVLVARQVVDFWDRVGRPEPFTLLEVGAGDGTLAEQVLEAIVPPLSSVLRYVAVERSAAARLRAAARLAGDPRVAVADSIHAVAPAARGCVVANEVVDNVPAHLVRATDDGLVERGVGLSDDAFVFVDLGPPPDPVARLVPTLAPRQEAGVSPAALELLEAMIAGVGTGYVWIADYAWRTGGSPSPIHAYRRHREARDVLDAPGSRDITMGIDIDALAGHARRAGHRVWGPRSQRDALLALGFEVLQDRAEERQRDAVRGRRGVEALRISSNRTRANLLVQPGGLGDFHVLCVGVGEVPPEPPRSMA
jgi:NADH dehydrogenase [ubiquinone] 1 alpha subcomplex assembly factor 7